MVDPAAYSRYIYEETLLFAGGEVALSVFNNLKYIFNRLAGRFHVPPGLINSTESKIVHISDTPTTLYPAIESLLYTLEPDVVIHTGDLADDIKLELDPQNIAAYDRAVAPFIEMLENSPAGEIYVVPGNHDDPEVIGAHVRRARLVAEGEVLSVKGMSLGLAHMVGRLPGISEYKLYGHDFSPGEQGGSLYLNGLKSVNVILSPSGRVERIPYPPATNYDRKMGSLYGIPGTV